MVWLGFYVATAIVVALAVFLGAEYLRRPETPAPQHPGVCAAAAGVLWPVLLVGVAQWALIAAIGQHLGRTATRPAGARWTAEPATR